MLLKNTKVITRHGDYIQEEIYDAAGNKVYVATFDEKENILSKTYSDGRSYHYEYDDNNNRIFMAASPGFWEEATYDKDNRLVSIETSDYGLERYSYDSEGRVTLVALDDGTTTDCLCVSRNKNDYYS